VTEGRTGTPARGDAPGADRARDESILAEVLGGPISDTPTEAMWAEIRPQLSDRPRGRLVRLSRVLAVAAAAAVLLVAVLLLSSPSGDDGARLRLKVIDVPEDGTVDGLSREEAAELFFGSEAPILLGSDDLATGLTEGGG
jgi:hypothetical protein